MSISDSRTENSRIVRDFSILTAEGVSCILFSLINELFRAESNGL
jgi:hypothetical protein